ncbi:MAG: lysostaphin resistance A-like protein, partial [Acidobacteriaceae bacterium]
SDELNSPEPYARAESSLENGASPLPPEPTLHPDIFGIPTPPQKIHPRRIPHLGHAVLFIAIALVLVSLVQLAGVFAIQYGHIFAHHTFQWIFRKSATDARFSIPIQAVAYGIIALVCIPVFSVMWHKSFGEGVHWHNDTAWTNVFRLVILGLAMGAIVALAGNYLPMPKNPPITQDMMGSATGAWLMLVFGITAAPLLEELAFRGFILPGFVNAFRWFSDHGAIPESAAKFIGIPVSILLTSIAFAFMHSPQVSHAWGPLLLIGLVSVVLCIIRLAMNSVMASVLVHAAYNFTLFAGVLYQTGGFRHLERLTS